MSRLRAEFILEEITLLDSTGGGLQNLTVFTNVKKRARFLAGLV